MFDQEQDVATLNKEPDYLKQNKTSIKHKFLNTFWEYFKVLY